jgi:hypothetical protein
VYPAVLLRKLISDDINLFSSVLLLSMHRFHKTVPVSLVSYKCTSHITQIWKLSAMYDLITYHNEWFIIHITGIYTLSTLYHLMSLQKWLSREWFITRITYVRTLSTMYDLMSLQI